MFREDLCLHPALTRSDADSHQQPPPQFTNGPGHRSMGTYPPGNAFLEVNTIDATLIRPTAGPVFHQMVVVAAAEDAEQRTRRQPVRPGEADLKIDQVRQPGFADDDVLPLVKIHVDDPALVHAQEQALEVGEEAIGNVLAMSQGMSGHIFAGNPEGEGPSFHLDRPRKRGDSRKAC
jgi:hypothetical protein